MDSAIVLYDRYYFGIVSMEVVGGIGPDIAESLHYHCFVL